MSGISGAQIRAIHTLKGAAGLDDQSYRDVLRVVAGVGSSKELSGSGAIRVIDRLKTLSGQAPGRAEARVKPSGALALEGPYAGICRALWISGWNLGVVEAREDTALVAFVRRQTGIDHLNWVRDAADGNKVVEALKAWLAREAHVDWSKTKGVSLAPIDRILIAQLRQAKNGSLSDREWHLIQRWQAGMASLGERNALSKQLGMIIRRRGK